MKKKFGKYSFAVSKEVQENKNFLDMACPKIDDRKKLFYVVAIALGIFVLGTSIFALTFWELTSRNAKFAKNSNVSTSIYSDGTTTRAGSSKIVSLLKDTTMPATNYEPKTESSKMIITPYPSSVKKQLDEMVCSHININSNLVMQEQYPKLFGAYERRGLVNGRMMYMNPKTKSRFVYGNHTYYSNYYDNRKDTEEYRTKWMVLFKNYLLFDINCNDIVPTNSSCNPQWRFCIASKLDVLELKLNCTIIENIILQCKNDSIDIKAVEDNQETCQELELSSNDGIAKTVPEIMGIYSLENYLFNDMVVYVHKDIGFELRFNYRTDLQNQLLRGAWEIYDGTYMLSYNLYCEDTDISTDGKCEFGWTYPSNDGFSQYSLDSSASIVCIKPGPVVTNIPAGGFCKTFQVMSTTAFEVEGIAYFLGEYTVTELTKNEMAVYLNRHNGYFFYWAVNNSGNGVWAIGPNLRLEWAIFLNGYCSKSENPVNGNCKYGWFYYNAESQEWKYDISMRIKCTNYVPNSIA